MDQTINHSAVQLLPAADRQCERGAFLLPVLRSTGTPFSAPASMEA